MHFFNHCSPPPLWRCSAAAAVITVVVSQQDGWDSQRKFNVVLHPLKVKGQCLVLLQNDVSKSAEYCSQFGFRFCF